CKRQCDRVLFGQYFVRGRDESRQPLVLAALGYTTQVRPHAIAHADRMAGSAEFLEHGLTRLQIERIAGIDRRIELRLVYLSAPLRIHGANVHDEAIEIAECRIPRPLAGRVVAEDDFIAVLAQGSTPVAEFCIDRFNVLWLSG